MKDKNRPIPLYQSVVHPVADGDNTDASDKTNPPTQVNSGQVDLVSGVCNPVGSALNTDKGTWQAPLPMRPIPS